MNVQVDVKLNGETVTVEGELTPYVPASLDRVNLPENRDLIVEKVIYKNVNIMPVLDDDQIEELSILAAEKYD